MPDDLYSPPTCPIYVDRLIADTTDLTDEEFGVYMRLMLGRQWPKGSIPADPADQARLTHNQTPAKMKKFAAIIGKRFEPHPTLPNAVHSPFMEKVRDDMRKRNKKNSQNGKRGADKRWDHDSESVGSSSRNHGENHGDAIAKSSPTVSRTDGFQSPVPISHHSPSGRDDAGAREGEPDHVGLADALSNYLLDAAIEYCSERGIRMAHWTGELHGKWLLDNRADALVLVQTYGIEACKLRALAFVVAIRDGKIASRIITTTMLLKCWNYRELTDVVKAADSGPSFDEMMGVA